MTAAFTRSLRVIIPLLGACALALTAGTSEARGELLGPGCGTRTLSQPFMRWLDYARYFPVPGGSFESKTPAWTLAGGAKVAAGNEPFYVRSAADKFSLALPAGSSATTPPMCVDSDELTLRLFAQSPGTVLSVLRIEALVTNLGITIALPVGVVPGVLRGWSPTLPTVFAVSLDQLLAGSTVRFRFRPLLFGTWRIDDTYVDPFKDR